MVLCHFTLQLAEIFSCSRYWCSICLLWYSIPYKITSVGCAHNSIRVRFIYCMYLDSYIKHCFSFNQAAEIYLTTPEFSMFNSKSSHLSALPTSMIYFTVTPSRMIMTTWMLPTLSTSPSTKMHALTTSGAMCPEHLVRNSSVWLV